MTDAHGASCAVWPRPLPRSPPEQAQATGKWRNNIRRGGSGTSQSERTTGTPGGSHLPFPGTTTGKESWAGADATADSLAAGRAGMRFLDNPDIVRTQMGDDDSVSICPEVGSFPQASCDFGAFSVNKPGNLSGART